MIATNEIKSNISTMLQIDEKEINTMIPKFDKFGYLSIHYHNLIKLTNRNEFEIKEILKLIENIEYVNKVDFVGQYCNVFISHDKYIEYFFKKFNVEYIVDSINIGDGKDILLEHTSSTPDSSPHLGRSRGTIIGDFLKNIFNISNFNVTTEYFVNDLAKQVSMIVSKYDFSRYYSLKEISNIYQSVYSNCEQNGKKEKEIEDQIKKCQDGEVSYKEKFSIVVDNCINEQNELFKDFQVHIDNYVYESNLLDRYKDKVLKRLIKTNLVKTYEEGCLYIPMYQGDTYLKDIFLTRTNGSSLYIFRDLCYFMKKYEEGCQNNIIVMPEYQQEHMNDVCYILEKMDMSLPKIVYYADTYNNNQKMSTKNGSGVLLEDIMNDLRKKGLEFDFVFNQNKIDNIVNRTIRKYILNTKSNKKIIFNYREIEKLYYSEIKKELLLEKLKTSNSNLSESSIASFDLIKKLDMMDDVIDSSLKSLQARPILQYEKELDELFSCNYEKGEINRQIVDSYILVTDVINRLLIVKERSAFKNENCYVYTNKIK